jgi:hypothetical protein
MRTTQELLEKESNLDTVVNLLLQWAGDGKDDLTFLREGNTRCICFKADTGANIEWELGNTLDATRTRIVSLRELFADRGRLHKQFKSVRGADWLRVDADSPLARVLRKADNTKRACLTLYRNRDLVKIKPSGDFWERHDERLNPFRTENHNETQKYPGYMVWQSNTHAEEAFASTPARAMVSYDVDGKERFGNVELPTVKVTPCPHVGPMVLHSFERETIDTSSLPKTVWKQLGKKGGKVVVLVQFRKKKNIDTSVEKDDITGEINVYRVRKFLLLLKP